MPRLASTMTKASNCFTTETRNQCKGSNGNRRRCGMAQRLSFVLHHGYRSNAPLSDPWPWLLGYSAVQARERSWLCQVTCESDGGVHTRDGAQSRVRWYTVST